MFYSHFSVPNFKRSVLLCIDADFCVQICVGKRLTRSTNSTFFSGAKFSKISKFWEFFRKFLQKIRRKFWQILMIFRQFLDSTLLYYIRKCSILLFYSVLSGHKICRAVAVLETLAGSARRSGKRFFAIWGRHFRSEFATKWRVATVVTGNEAQFGHTVWKLMILLLKSTKIWFKKCYFFNVKRLTMSCKSQKEYSMSF